MREKGTVVVFGIFDGVHEGHRSLFRQARQSSPQSVGGQAKDVELVAIVGRDSSCRLWKNKIPTHTQEERVFLVGRERDVDKAVLGDEEQSSYRILEGLNPDIVCLGYDQEALGRDLAAWIRRTGFAVEIRQARAFRPETLHSSLLGKS